LDIGADLTLTDLGNPEVLCKSGLARENKCNSISYGENMTVDSKSNLVKCDWSNDAKCHYKNSDNSTYDQACECTLNAQGDSYCPAAQAASIY